MRMQYVVCAVSLQVACTNLRCVVDCQLAADLAASGETALRDPGADVAGVSPVPVQMWQG